MSGLWSWQSSVLSQMRKLFAQIIYFLKQTINLLILLDKNFPGISLVVQWTSLVAQLVKHLPTMWETRVRSLGREDPLEKEMATHSSTLAWKIPWTEEPGRLQSMGLQRVGHNWATSLHFTSLPVVKPQSFHSRRHRINPWSGKLRFFMQCSTANKTNKQTKTTRISWFFNSVIL